MEKGIIPMPMTTNFHPNHKVTNYFKSCSLISLFLQATSDTPEDSIRCQFQSWKNVYQKLQIFKAAYLSKYCNIALIKGYIAQIQKRLEKVVLVQSTLHITKIQQDAKVCRCLFTVKLLYTFRASIAPIVRSIIKL